MTNAKKCKFLFRTILLSLSLFNAFWVPAQLTDLVILDSIELAHLKTGIKNNKRVKNLYDSILVLANTQVDDSIQPLAHIHYEGLLDNDESRISSVKSLKDIEKLGNFVYAFYGNAERRFADKARMIVIRWSSTYLPDGNTINENKLVPVFWAYHIFKSQFSEPEKQQVEAWLNDISLKQMHRSRTPNNNWEAKRQKIIGSIGCILANNEMIQFAVNGFKEYIASAYYPDGTSNDLRERDALHYHIGGLTPAVAFFITAKSFDSTLDLFSYVSSTGSSIRKSVEYVLPYASGQATRSEWTNSKVALDKKRAESGLAKYQPGALFDPSEAFELFEWAVYYNRDWYSLFDSRYKSPHQGSTDKYASTWIGLLNSPLVRGK
ncbi:alginate lyase family protein [Flavitalea antarctica]